jgi:hypothetical protein
MQAPVRRLRVDSLELLSRCKAQFGLLVYHVGPEPNSRPIQLQLFKMKTSDWLPATILDALPMILVEIVLRSTTLLGAGTDKLKFYDQSFR